MIDIKEEKMRRTVELRKALEAVSVGIDATGQVSQEAIEVATVILNTRKKIQLMLRTPAVDEFIRTIERSLDSLDVAEKEQVDPKKRKRAIGEILERLDRDIQQLGLENPRLVDAVHVEVPEETRE